MKYKDRIKKVHGYCRWNHKYPPENWCVFGVAKWWYEPERHQYRLCFFGLEIRIDISRKFKQD